MEVEVGVGLDLIDGVHVQTMICEQFTVTALTNTIETLRGKCTAVTEQSVKSTTYTQNNNVTALYMHICTDITYWVHIAATLLEATSFIRVTAQAFTDKAVTHTYCF